MVRSTALPLTHTQVLDAYQRSVSVLQSMRKGLTLERVEETLGELKVTMEDGQDIASALSEGKNARLVFL